MQSIAVEVNDVEPIVVNTGRTGQTVELRICRHSDGFFLDWSDDTFRTVGSVVTLDQTLTAKDAINAPGIYQLASVSHPSGLDTSALGLSAAVDDTLIVIVNVTAGPAFASTKVPPGEISLLALIDACLTRKTVHSELRAKLLGDATVAPAPSPCPPVTTTYKDAKGVDKFTHSNDGAVRTTVP